MDLTDTERYATAALFALALHSTHVESGVDRNGNSLSECDIAWGCPSEELFDEYLLSQVPLKLPNNLLDVFWGFDCMAPAGLAPRLFAWLKIPRKAWPGLLRMPDLAGSAGSPEAVEGFVALVRRAFEQMWAAQAMSLDPEVKPKYSSSSRAVAYLKVGAAAVGGGALLAVTGGLAAPAIAAGLGAAVTLAHGGAAAAAAVAGFAGSTAGTAAMTGLFGAWGASVGGGSAGQLYGEVKEFGFWDLSQSIYTDGKGPDMGQPPQATANPSIRLDCEPEVAKELVAIVRHGSSYEPPADNPRLLKALQHQLDYYLGIPVPGMPAASSKHSQEYIVVPAGGYDVSQYELLMYSAANYGWAALTDKRYKPPWVKELGYLEHLSYEDKWLATVIPSESNGLGADAAFLLPNGPRKAERSGTLLRGDLTRGSFRASDQHKLLCDSSMVAAQGKLYLLGGSLRLRDDMEDVFSPKNSPCQVFDPHVNQWFDTVSPFPDTKYLVQPALVTNKAEAVLLSIGGYLTDNAIDLADAADDNLNGSKTDQVSMYDIRSSRWSIKPSGCRFSRAAQAEAVTAAYVDDWNIMVISAQPQEGQGAASPRQRFTVDVLDLRTWGWREMPDVPCPGLNSGGWEIPGVSALQYQGKVHLLAWSEWLGCFDADSSSWTELPAVSNSALICNAAPVAMRLPCLLK
eukprot:gene2488-2791_t